MITIHKYKLQITERQTLQLPEGAEIMSVQTQLGAFQIEEVGLVFHAFERTGA